MQNTYLAKRARLENYFNEVSSDAWDKLTSNEPVSFVRQLVREGREKMQAAIMEKLPKDLRGARILDAGCGTGVLSRMLDERGAEVVGVDISEKLIEVAKNRSSLNKNIELLEEKSNEYIARYSDVPAVEKTLRSIEREQEIKEALFLLLLQKFQYPI